MSYLFGDPQDPTGGDSAWDDINFANMSIPMPVAAYEEDHSRQTRRSTVMECPPPIPIMSEEDANVLRGLDQESDGISIVTMESSGAVRGFDIHTPAKDPDSTGPVIEDIYEQLREGGHVGTEELHYTRLDGPIITPSLKSEGIDSVCMIYVYGQGCPSDEPDTASRRQSANTLACLLSAIQGKPYSAGRSPADPFKKIGIYTSACFDESNMPNGTVFFVAYNSAADAWSSLCLDQIREMLTHAFEEEWKNSPCLALINFIAFQLGDKAGFVPVLNMLTFLVITGCYRDGFLACAPASILELPEAERVFAFTDLAKIAVMMMASLNEWHRSETKKLPRAISRSGAAIPFGMRKERTRTRGRNKAREDWSGTPTIDTPMSDQEPSPVHKKSGSRSRDGDRPVGEPVQHQGGTFLDPCLVVCSKKDHVSKPLHCENVPLPQDLFSGPRLP